MWSDHCAAGYDPMLFWTLTPRSWRVLMAGAEEKFRRDRWLAWHIAYLPHAKEAVPLKKFAGKPTGPAKPQTAEEIGHALRAWTVSLGGKVIEK